MTDETNKLRLLELAPPELVVPLKVTHAGRAYRLRHVFRPPAPADWFAYEAALEMAVEELPPASDSDEPCYRLQVRSTDAALLLWDRLVLRVEGYDLPGEGSEGDWRALIPLAHKEAALGTLTLVAPAQAPPLSSISDEAANNAFPLLAGERLVVLEAVVAGRAYPRLLHYFRPPSVEAERTYRRLLSETLLVRGSRSPRTLLPARLPALVRLYDDLILRVEGYAVGGQLLASPAEIARRMDAWHKRLAVQTLFGETATALSSDAFAAPAPNAAILEPGE